VARKTGLTSLQNISEINLTPLMDLTFILLITFIITFPLIEQGIPVNLPAGKANELKAKTAQTVTVDEKGNIFLNDAPTTLQDLDQAMREIAEVDSSVTVMVRADEGIQYAEVVRVLRVLHGAGIARTALVTRGEEET
jgi:biopolymer transport protein TolR